MSGRTHQRLDDAGITDHVCRSFQFVKCIGISVISRFQSKFRMSQFANFLTIHGKIHRTCTWHHLNTHFFAIIKFFSPDSLNLGHYDIRLMLINYSHQSISVQHIENLTLIRHLHGRRMCISITCNDILSLALARNDKFLS